ncbi:MAG: hypothetical protein WAN68_20860, partial [Pseudolabrys sp.]
GYDRTGFFEVDTGEQRSWTVQLTDAAEQPPERPLAPRGPVGVSRPPTTPPLTPPSSPMTPPSATSPTSPGGSRQ